MLGSALPDGFLPKLRKRDCVRKFLGKSKKVVKGASGGSDEACLPTGHKKKAGKHHEG